MTKNNKIFKTGFTLAETLISLGIIGILTMVSITTLKPHEQKGTKYFYSSAYQALLRAYYNGYKLYNPFKLTPEENAAANKDDIEVQKLCKALTSYINTNNITRQANEVQDDGTVIRGYDYNENCEAPTTMAVSVSIFPDNFVAFRATNGMKFYLTKKVTDNVIHRGVDFFIIYVDINGDEGPNSITPTEQGLPDIYAFAALDSRRVIPLGMPEYDARIMTAKLGYWDEDSGDPLYGEESMAYYQAKSAAWGYYTQVNSPIIGSKYEPYSLNDDIRSIITSKYRSNKIYENFPANIYSDDWPKSGTMEGEPFHCRRGNFDECFIHIDSYSSL